MSTHTPGPWAVNPKNAQVDAFVDGIPLAICQLLWPTDERTEAETEANALLIAAAPDLLAALKSVLATRGGTMALTASDMRVVAIRAAISKAEGRA